ncbi:MAG TPA: ferrochelatase [Ilumatobacter sp.]|nr:ferrochelatase [Ilumatobacter sp.]
MTDPEPRTADRIAVVLMAYGTPATPEAIEEYYTDIRRGRPPTPEQLADLTGRYAAIGGVSPLAARTKEQRAAVQAALDELAPGRYTVVLGLKHSHPKIEQAVADVLADGYRTIVAAVLAPHFSEMSIGEYVHRVEAAAADAGVTVRAVRSWARLPEFVDFVARDLQHRLDAANAARGAAKGRTRVLFTAHSLPERIVAAGDPYPAELRATAEAVAAQLGLREGSDWRLAWQSAGRTPEPWLGPDVGEVIGDGSLADVDTLVVSAVGFVSDHLEVLYDLDLEARHLADEAGLAFDRTSCVNADPAVMAGLARLIHEAT